MERIKLKKIPNKKVINASDIGQFEYCSISWYLQKLGYKPDSKLLDRGTNEHIRLGKVIDKTQRNIKISIFLKITGFLLIALLAFLLFSEVFL